MKKIILSIVTVFAFSLLIACGGSNADNQKAEQELQKMDSIAAEMEQTIENLENQTKELEKEVDDILNDLE